MENLLKRQLAQIKARARMLAGRATPEDVAIGTNREGEAPAAEPPAVEPHESVSLQSALQTTTSSRPTATASNPISNPIIDAAIRSGLVTRGANVRPFAPARRGLWWWRRRVARGGLHPAPREGSNFEAEFQQVLAEMAAGDPLSIEDAVPGERRTIQDAGYYLIGLAGADIDAAAVPEAERFARFSRWPESASRAVVGPRRAPADLVQSVADALPAPDGVLFLDIETAGLSANTYVFLCGLMYMDAGRFRVEQVFARDYTEETGILRHVRETMARFDTVVTYNGASFDLPFLRTRMAVHRIPDVKPVGSVDLLHSSRRVFREILPNCRLVTVERHLRGVDRVDDIPSRFIPRAYHEYVRTRDARIMRNVVYHNRMDLFTMAVILNHFADAPFGGVEKPFSAQPVGDTMAAPNPPHVPL